jgi:hypothetical protein
MAWRNSLRKEEIQFIDAINTQLDSGANISMSWIKDRLKLILANQRHLLIAKITEELNLDNVNDNNMRLMNIAKKIWETMDSMESQLDSMELDSDHMAYPLYNFRNSSDMFDDVICNDNNYINLLSISNKMWETVDFVESQLDSMKPDTALFQEEEQAWDIQQNMVNTEVNVLPSISLD